MLVGSSNDVPQLFALYIGKDFLLSMNTFLQSGLYTKSLFYNGTGLDPLDKKFPVNRLTPYNTMHLVKDVYTGDAALTTILAQKEVSVTNMQTGEIIKIKSTNELNTDPLYKDRVVLSKTGRTNRAGENLVFVTHGGRNFDYIVVVLLSSKNRHADGKVVVDWLRGMEVVVNQ
jgi:D-alanyl-D-alanine carboxypeptidase